MPTPPNNSLDRMTTSAVVPSFHAVRLWRAPRHRSALRSARASNANGVLSPSPGLRRQALPWVTRSQIESTPTGLCLARDRTPLGFSEISGVFPRVAARSSRQPWAGGRNAVGVPWDRHLPCGSNAEPTAPNPARALKFRFEPSWCRVGEPRRSAKQPRAT